MQKTRINIIYPIFISHLGCPFKCVFCDQVQITNTQAIDWETTFNDVNKFINKNKDEYKEIAFFGGSFTCLSINEMQELFQKFSSILDDKTYFRISTRPDAINEEILLFLKHNRVNTIELGIQSFSDKELLACKRGYDSVTAMDACKSIKNHDFSLSVQLLIGLPKADNQSYNDCLQKLLFIKPDFVRLYPLLVLKGTELEESYRQGNYKPLLIDEAVHWCFFFYKKCCENDIKVIKIGLHSDILKESVIAGPYHANIGEVVKGLMLVDEIINYSKNMTINKLIISDKSASLLNAYNKYAKSALLKIINYNVDIIVDKFMSCRFLIQ